MDKESRMRRPKLIRSLALTAASAVVIAACGGGAATAIKKKPPRTTTTTTVAIPTAPLTGLPDPQGVARGRSALSVKIENTPEARPQSGLDTADVVYEEVVEFGITRFWAIFNSNAPTQVGPVRSVRQMDPNVVSPLGGVVAYSGGTDENVALIRQAPIVWVDENNANNGAGEPACAGSPAATFCRDATRNAPHDLYARTVPLWQRGGKPVPPSPLFSYLNAAKGQTFSGTPVASFKVGFDLGYDVTYQWDPAVGWKRVQGTQPFLSDHNTQIAATNVIVQSVTYTGAGGEGQLISQGDAWIFSNGQLIQGHWTKTTATQPIQYTDANGAPIALTPGRTWVELLPTGRPVDITPGPPVVTTGPSTTSTTTKKKH
jgi:hypothetical protein